MNGSNNGRVEIEQLIDRLLDGSCEPSEARRVRELLQDDPAALDAYLEQVRMHAMLQWRHGGVRPSVPAAVSSVASMAITGASTGRDDGPKGRGRQWSRGRQLSRAPTPGHPGRPWHGRRRAVAATVVLAAALAALAAVWVPRLGRRTGTPPEVAGDVVEVTEVRDVVWAKDQPPLAVGVRLPPRAIAIESGTLRLRSNTGAAITLAAGARVQVLSNMRLRATRGRVTVRVGSDAHGFTVEAPGADVVDLGTEFGVQVGEAGQTDVVVFEGQVDLNRKAAPGTRPASQPSPTRLTKGEGLRVDPDGRTARIVTVQGRPGGNDRGGAGGGGDWAVGGKGDRKGIIASVRDNLRSPAAPKYYQIVDGGLAAGVPAYVDRSYEWVGIGGAGLPPELRGADLVMTFNSDKRAPNLELTVALAKPAVLYVFHEPRHGEVPDWLRRDFVDTGLKIGLNEKPTEAKRAGTAEGTAGVVGAGGAAGTGRGGADRVFHVWRREVAEPGSVMLGDNSPDAKSMYGIAAAPLP